MTSLRDILAGVVHDRIPIAATFLVMFGTAVLISLGMTLQYETEARLLVLPGQEYTSQPLTLDGASAGNLVSDQISKAEIEVLSSNDLRREVVRRIGAASLYPALASIATDVPGASAEDRASRLLGEELVIEPQQDSSVVRVRYRHPDPAMAGRVVNELVEAYLGMRLAVFDRDRAEFLAPLRDEAEAAVGRAWSAVAAFDAERGVASLADEVALRLEQRTRLALQAFQARQAAAGDAAQRDALGRRIAALPAQVVLTADRSEEAESGNSRATLLSLQLRRQELLAKYAETSGFVQDVDQQIAALRSFEARTTLRTGSATNVGPNPAIEPLRVARDTAEAAASGELARAAETERQAEDAQGRLAALGAMRPEQRRLEREVEMAEVQARLLTRRYEDAQALEAFDRRRAGNVRVTQLAGPGRQTRSGRLLVIGAGLVLGAVAAAAVAGLRGLLRDTMLTPSGAAARLGLPVLVAVTDRP